MSKNVPSAQIAMILQVVDAVLGTVTIDDPLLGTLETTRVG